MSNSRFREILKSWIENVADQEQMVSLQVDVRQSDYHKLEALAELYGQPMSAITNQLLHSSIREIEEAMPYEAGDRVIRVEDGLDIYEDVGPTPRYLEIVKRKKGGEQ